MESKEQENQQELHSCYASEAELVMTEEIKKALDEQSKAIWKQLEEKLFEEFIKLFEECWKEKFPD